MARAKICARCGQVLRSGTEPATHGICPEYLRKYESSVGDTSVSSNVSEAEVVNQKEPDQPDWRGNAALRKLGAQRECLLRGSSFKCTNRVARDHILWALLDDDWRRVRPTRTT